MQTFQPPQDSLEKLRAVLGEQDDIDLAVLIGSQSTGEATAASDWDIAVRLRPSGTFFQDLGRMETVRRLCAAALGVPDTRIDLIDLRMARLAIRAVAAEEGIPVKGDETLNWSHFLRRTWRELEEYYFMKEPEIDAARRDR